MHCIRPQSINLYKIIQYLDTKYPEEKLHNIKNIYTHLYQHNVPQYNELLKNLQNEDKCLDYPFIVMESLSK